MRDLRTSNISKTPFEFQFRIRLAHQGGRFVSAARA
jgi:hypothetical protein